MGDTPVPVDELEDAKRAIVAGFALSLESPQRMLGYYTERWTVRFAGRLLGHVSVRISAVTAADVQAMARKYWDPSRLQIVAVGDASKITDVLRKRGQLEVFDADGNVVK